MDIDVTDRDEAESTLGGGLARYARLSGWLPPNTSDAEAVDAGKYFYNELAAAGLPMTLLSPLTELALFGLAAYDPTVTTSMVRPIEPDDTNA